MNRIRVVIAEDEPPIARFIKTLVEADGVFDVVALHENGEEVLNNLKEECPQILITDIRMSGMTGIDLIKKVRFTDPDIRVIIISGYKMFEYAKEAISLGIEDYITKPIDPDEFNIVLSRIKKYYTDIWRAEQQDDLERAFANNHSEVVEKLLCGNDKLAQVMMIYGSGDVEDYVQNLSQDNHVLEIAYRNALFVLLTDSEKNAATADRSFRRILVACRFRTVASVRIQSFSLESGEDIIENIKILYNVARKKTIPGKRTETEWQILEDISEPSYGEDMEVLKQIRMVIAAGNWGLFKERIYQLFEVWKKEEVSVYRIYMLLHILTDSVLQSGMIKSDSVKIREYIDESIRYADSYEEIRENYSVIFENLDWEHGAHQKTAEKNGQKLFEEINAFIEDNRDRCYSLKEICNLFKASQPYVRKIFKMQTGLSYSEYILQNKINSAKKMIEINPDLLIKDVAESFGYEQFHFSKVFTKITGVNPSKYKIMMLEKRT
ncbi:MAG: response regulator [Lachnospiraceae bacterium]